MKLLRITARLVRWLLVLVRVGVWVISLTVTASDPAAHWIAQNWHLDIKPYIPWVLASSFLGETLLRNKKLIERLKRYLLQADLNFATVLWPEQPPNHPRQASIPGTMRRLVRAQCHARQAVQHQKLGAGLASLPQSFWAYRSLAAFLGDNPTLLARLGVSYNTIGTRLAELGEADQPRESGALPWLNKHEKSTTGSLVVITGEAGSGKSRALLQEVVRQMPADDEEGRQVLPVYLDLADWHKLFDVTDGYRLERWACAFICKQYDHPPEGAQPIRPEEAIWLLHRLSREHVRLVLCLDGLDELPPEFHQECLEAILDYKASYGHVVLTCRKKELTGCLLALTDEQQATDCQVIEVRDFATEAEVDEAIIRHQLGPGVAPGTPLADLPAPLLAAARQAAAPLLAYRRTHQMQQYLTTPLLLNLFVKVFSPDTPLVEAPVAAGQPAMGAPALWAKYEELKRTDSQDSRQYGEQWSQRWQHPAAWPAFRSYLRTIALLAPSNSFTLDTIQPHRWLAAPPEPAAAGTASGWLSHLSWYYLTSRLLVGLLLAVAVGLLIARPTAFLGDGVLVGGLAALFTKLLNRRLARQAATKSQLRRRWVAGHPRSARARWAWRVRAALWQRWYVLLALGLLGLLVLVCGTYEGLAVPRKPGDMQLHGLFSVTQATLGVIVGLIAGTVLGFRRAHTRDTDISLVEKLGFKWLEALWVGVLGGVGMGTLVGLIGVGLVARFPGMTLDTWLLPFLPGWKQHLPWLMHRWPAHADALAVFSLAFVVAGLVGFVLLALLASLDRKHGMLEEDERNRRVRYGVAQSARHGIFNGLVVVGLLLVGLFGLAARPDGQYLARLGRYLSIGLGAGLIAFLWFGGVEVIQHYTLRVHLALLRRLPLRFGQWLADARELVFVQGRSGPSIKFMHATLQSYLQQTPAPVPGPAPARRWGLWVFRRVIVLLMVGLLAAPLLRRWYPVWPATAFWAHNSAFVLHPAAGVQVLNDSTIRVQRAGRLHLTVRGRVHVGDIVGSVGPQGTAYGFLGIGLSHAYDRFRQGNHGALFYQIERAGHPTAWQPLLPAGQRTPWLGPSVGTLPELMQPGELVRFALNDAEWQNNSGAFELAFAYGP